MKRNLVATLMMVGMFFVSGCFIQSAADNCAWDSDCPVGQYCSSHNGQPICKVGCYVENVEVADWDWREYDSCNPTVLWGGYTTGAVCDRAERMCTTYNRLGIPDPWVTDVAQPDDPNPRPQGQDVWIQCCYTQSDLDWFESVNHVTLYGQFSWSESTQNEPIAWGSASDLQNVNGCFSANVERYTCSNEGCFYVDLTAGLAENDQWVPQGQLSRPVCYVDGALSPVDSFYQGHGWPFRD